MECINQDQLSDNHGGSLEVDGLPAVIVQGLDIQQSWFDMGCDLGQEPLKVSEKRGIVKSPFRSFLFAGSITACLKT